MPRGLRLVIGGVCVIFILGLGLICVFFISPLLPNDALVCGQAPSPSALYRVLSLLRLGTAYFTRHRCLQFGDNQFDHLRIVTWPTWATNAGTHASLNLDGYAIAVSKCAKDAIFRFDMINRILSFTGQPLDSSFDLASVLVSSDTLPWSTNVPLDYLSRSVSGANISLDDAHPNLTVTNQLGHFEIISTASDDGHAVQEHRVELHCTRKHRGKTSLTAATSLKAYHLSRTSLIIVSDIDDVLRVAKVWDWDAAVRKLFLEKFTPWRKMDETLHRWRKAVANIHFHYATDAPEMSNEFYVRGIEEQLGSDICAPFRFLLTWWCNSFPLGSFSFRPMSFGTLSRTLNSRYENSRKLLMHFPQTRFVLLGDTATGSTLSAYSRLAREHPNQVQCLLIRNVSATEPANWIVPDLAQLPADRTLLFEVPDDLQGFEKHLVNLADGLAQGCGDMFVHRSLRRQSQIREAIGSWTATLWGGIIAYLECMWLTDRPSPRYCRLDRKSLEEARLGSKEKKKEEE